MNVADLGPVRTEDGLDEKVPDEMDVKEDPELQSSPSSKSSANVDEFPDGGFRSWAVVLGAFWTFFATVGYLSSWGVFQVYYQQVKLPHSSPSQIAWIGSVARCIVFLPGVFVGRLVDVGVFRATFALGSLLIIVGTFLIPVCTLFWHFLLCQGFMIGLGCGLTYGPCITVVTHWWKRKRGLALGVASSGSAVGGIFFPVVLRNILPKLGFIWTLRIVGFILVFAFSIANLCLARRLPPRKAAGGFFGLRVFRNAAFAVYALSCFFTLFGAFNAGAYLTSSAVSYGLSSNTAFYFVAMHNGSSFFGAVVFGILSDRLGPMNVLIPTITAIGVITIVWPFCGTVPSLSIISVLYGITLAAFGSLSLLPIAAMGGTEDLGRRMGIMNTVFGIGTLCGAPLGGLLVSTSLGYKAVGYFSGEFMPHYLHNGWFDSFLGGMIFLGSILLALARYLAVARVRAKF
ncbi:Riboflavin transporter mch5 [Mycena venus]|uniref:Riboflavin transporter mch5 n=1 Tax=Mycena venus TaxID=2733690 RepID=A0A8H6XMR9_9AGAR|nr:Riboflavin transporter mch5 [Mycena venus]